MMGAENNSRAIPLVFGKQLKNILIGSTIVGLLALLWGLVIEGAPASRLWANIWLNSLLFLFIGLGGLFFWAVNMLGESGWHISLQRIPEAMGQTIPVAAILFLLALPGMKEIFHWTHPDPSDAIMAGKSAFLNIPFFIVRMLIYFGGWVFFARRLRSLSLQNDLQPVENYLKKMRTTSAFFIAFFALTSSLSAWDWLMSFDAHWYSTMYGFYIFSGMFVIALSVIIILIIALRHYGIMPHITNDNLSDLGKYLFGFSFFWAYLLLNQFMLIWYSNIPEETVYFVQRMEHFKVLFYFNLAIGFVLPFFALMSRGSKRQPLFLLFIAVIILIGHWVDLYLAIMPGAVGGDVAKIGILEIGLPFLYLAIFSWFFLKSFAKAKVIPENHPYFKESIGYEDI